ncbi:MAG: hypothetical protein IKU12_05430 [Oscillospiraceae bacterium]|nr:hypothetical protein [Oscillospiraceae bacterium]
MSHFPFFVELAEETALLIGDVSQAKEDILTSFGCRTLRCNVLTEELLDDLSPALVVIEQGDPRNETWACLCRVRSIPVNVVDTPELCTFFFPAMVRRGDLTAAISTSGKSPAMGVEIKAKLEELLPEDLACAVEELFVLRSDLMHLSANERSSILRRKAKEFLKF